MAASQIKAINKQPHKHFQNNEMNTFTNTRKVQLELQYFRQPVEIFNATNEEAIQVSHESCAAFSTESGMSATKLAFLRMANAPVMNVDYDDSTEEEDSDPEILLSDSEDEDYCQDEDEANTAIDSQDLNDMASEMEKDDLDVFDEHSYLDLESLNKADAKLKASKAF